MVIESEQLIKSTLVENKRRHYINISELGHLVQFVGV
jgi:hypothetical protein